MKILNLLENFSDETIDELLYLVHDKSHVIKQGEKNPRLEEVLKKPKIAPVLYRGVSKKELERIKSGKPINYYLSASESLETAKKFGSSVVTITGASGFCYWQWLKNHFEKIKKEDESLFDSIDGQHMIDVAKSELEWILPFGCKFKASGKNFKIADVS